MYTHQGNKEKPGNDCKHKTKEKVVKVAGARSNIGISSPASFVFHNINSPAIRSSQSPPIHPASLLFTTLSTSVIHFALCLLLKQAFNHPRAFRLLLELLFDPDIILHENFSPSRSRFTDPLTPVVHFVCCLLVKQAFNSSSSSYLLRSQALLLPDQIPLRRRNKGASGSGTRCPRPSERAWALTFGKLARDMKLGDRHVCVVSDDCGE